MLSSLQSNVESEENKWKKRVSDKEEELSASLSRARELEEKVSALEASLQVVSQAEEVKMKV